MAISAVHAEMTEEALSATRVDDLLVGGAGDLTIPDAPATSGPANDAYSLRLVATRRMYDDGVALRHSASSAGLGRIAEVRLNPTDFDKLGVENGSVVKLASSRGYLLAPVKVDTGVPVGSAVVPFSVDGWGANQLIDGDAAVTDVRVERP